MDGLTAGYRDPALQRHTFIVVDFETLTPKGRRPVPIEVAALAIRPDPTGEGWTEGAQFSALIRPPDDLTPTRFDIAQTGITPADLADAPAAATVLATLDQLFQEPPYRLVAHNAPYEAGLLADHASSCPTLAATALLDTVRLARVVYPHLPNHRLDTVLQHLRIPIPPDRHRALADVVATGEVFIRIVADGIAAGRWNELGQMDAAAGLPPKASTAVRHEQTELF